MSRCQHHAVDAPQRGEHAVVDAGQARPPGRDLHGVDDVAALDEVPERGHVVAPLEPVVEQRGIVRGGAGALGARDVQHRVDERGIALVEHEEDGVVAGGEVPIGFDGVVEPQHTPGSRRDAGCGDRRRDRRRMPGTEGGAHLGHRGRVHPQARAGDHPRFPRCPRTAGSGRARPRRAVRRRCARCGRRRARRRAEHHVLDLPVARRELPGAAARQPAADGREVDRLGPVAEVTSWSVRNAASRGAPKVPARTSRTSASVDADDPGDRGEVEDDAAVHGHARPTHAAAPRRRR